MKTKTICTAEQKKIAVNKKRKRKKEKRCLAKQNEQKAKIDASCTTYLKIHECKGENDKK